VWLLRFSSTACSCASSGARSALKPVAAIGLPQLAVSARDDSRELGAGDARDAEPCILKLQPAVRRAHRLWEKAPSFATISGGVRTGRHDSEPRVELQRRIALLLGTFGSEGLRDAPVVPSAASLPDCHLPAHRSQCVFGVIEPVDFRRNGATAFSAYGCHLG
jgi:hypothetical protein